MATITVSTEVLREKARLNRSLLDESKKAHQNLWTQMTTTAGTLPSDLRSTHHDANDPWNDAVTIHYESADGL